MGIYRLNMRRPNFVETYIWIMLVNQVWSLKCWKCISHDCGRDPEGNYKASAVSCMDGQECMKVRYRMFDNVTHYDSVVRTCSSGPCVGTTDNDFERCVATPKLYMISGCSLRSCCSDKDLCNNSSKPVIHSTCLLIILASVRVCMNIFNVYQS